MPALGSEIAKRAGKWVFDAKIPHPPEPSYPGEMTRLCVHRRSAPGAWATRKKYARLGSKGGSGWWSHWADIGWVHYPEIGWSHSGEIRWVQSLEILQENRISSHRREKA